MSFYPCPPPSPSSLPLTDLPFSPSIRSTLLFPTVASLSLTCRFFRDPSFLSRFVESGSSYLVRSLTAYSLVPGLRRHYRWRALNVFCLFHLPHSLPSVRRTLSVPRSIRPDVLAAVVLTWISYPVAFDNGAAPRPASSALQRNRGRAPALKNEVTRVSRP